MLPRDTVQLKDRVESGYAQAQSEFDGDCQLVGRFTTDPDSNQAIQQRETSSDNLLRFLSKLDDLQQEVSTMTWGEIDAPSVVANCRFITIQGNFIWTRPTCPALSFRHMEFGGEAAFKGARFSGEVTFSGTQFAGKADFSETIFPKNIDFSSCVFKSEVSFVVARVIGKARFRLVQFHGPAYFVLITFEREAYFSDCRFQSLNFQGARFNATAWFQDAAFSEMVKLSRAKFYAGAFFGVFGSDEERRKVRGIFDCDEAIFSAADFTNREFCGRTDFSRAVFETAPRFHGARLHQDTSFSDTRFLAAEGILSGWRRWWSFAKSLWRQPPKRLEGINLHFRWMQDRAVADRNAYRTLKQHMGAIRAQEEEGIFFALEQRAARQATPFWKSPLEKCLSWGYDLVSQYGQDPGRALTCWLIWNWVFYAGYSNLTDSPVALLNPSCIDECKESFLASDPPLGLALQAAINPLALLGDKTLFLVPVAHPWVFASVALQTVGSISIFTLLLLAIRRRFHKGSE